MTDYGWLATEDVYATAMTADDGELTVYFARVREDGSAVLRTGDDGRVSVNGQFYDFGDDFPAILGLLDEVPADAIRVGLSAPDPDADEHDAAMNDPDRLFYGC